MKTAGRSPALAEMPDTDDGNNVLLCRCFHPQNTASSSTTVGACEAAWYVTDTKEKRKRDINIRQRNVLVNSSSSFTLTVIMAHVSWWKTDLGRLLKIFGLAAAIFGVMLGTLAGYVFWKVHTWPPPPNEKYLKAVFTAKRRLFEQLVHMSFDDAATITVGNGLLHSERLSRERVMQYRDLAASIDPDLEFSASFGVVQSFTFQEDGFLLSIGPHCANGIEYIPPPNGKLLPIVENVERAKSLKLDEYWIPLTDEWYIFHTEY